MSRHHSDSVYTRRCCLLIGVWLIVSTAGPAGVTGYPDGAPASTCSNMMPQHGAQPQTSTSPYTITVSGSSYQAGQPVTVTITVNSGSSSLFNGFLLEARLQANNSAVGSFTSPQSLTQLVCQNGVGLTHTDSSIKRSISATWSLPSAAAGLGSISFVATVMFDFSTFWTNVASNILPESSPSTVPVSVSLSTVPTSRALSSSPSSATAVQPSPTLTLASTTTAVPAISNASPTLSSSTVAVQQPFGDVDMSGCGVSKTCFTSGCSNGSALCDYMLTWADAGDNVSMSFEMSASVTSTESWIAFGLSEDDEMADDSVISCISSAGRVFVEASWNIEGGNEPLSPSNLGLVNGSTSAGLINSRIVCRFERVKVLPSSKRRRAATQTTNLYALDGSTNYYLLMAKGPVSGGVKRYHGENTVVSATTINFTQVHVPSSSSGDIDMSGCGESKTCFTSGCSNGSALCDYMLTWADAGDNVSMSFEMSASVISADSWIAFGLSVDDEMADDSVISCISTAGRVFVEASWNIEGDNEPLSPNNLGLVNGSTSAGLINSRIVCRFQRVKVLPAGQTTNFYALDGSTNYYLLMAKGPVSGGVKSYHGDNTVVSAASINFTQVVSTQTSSSSTTACTHSITILLFAAAQFHLIALSFVYSVAWYN